MSRIWDFIDDHFVGVAVGVGVALLIGLICIDSVEQNKWEAFSSEHHCRIAGHIEASTELGVTSSGKFGTVFVPAKTIYKCDNDYTEIR